MLFIYSYLSYILAPTLMRAFVVAQTRAHCHKNKYSRGISIDAGVRDDSVGVDKPCHLKSQSGCNQKWEMSAHESRRNDKQNLP
jgi:hypothetical protein